jgi:cytochrome b involved in lipid metabolism
MVYDVTKYLNDHPGGPEVMLDYAGENENDYRTYNEFENNYNCLSRTYYEHENTSTSSC